MECYEKLLEVLPFKYVSFLWYLSIKQKQLNQGDWFVLSLKMIRDETCHNSSELTAYIKYLVDHNYIIIAPIDDITLCAYCITLREF